ncbi:MAG: Asp-tRNA(Asn)/Glu-tRNA(Gln) amidotransferase subunit GatB [Thermodesulfobacteriota bacterium]
MEFEAVIGLEVHAHLSTQSKIFCSCPATYGALPNTQVCPVCLGMPGVLPVLNKTVVEYAMRMALAVDCQVAEHSVFARKNYFYPDLPKNYQISQYENPLAEHGKIEIETAAGRKRVGITRIHMEEDAGKLTHDGAKSRVDLNRTGVPLIEIVSEPDMSTPEEAGAYLRKLHAILRYLDICDGNMEQGSFRCDANVSVRRKGEKALGTRAELKNMNSFKNVERGLAFEINRQTAICAEGGVVVQETRLFDATSGRTEPMRGKEEAHDYRYFPDPDLVPLRVDQTWKEQVRSSLPELPDAKKERFVAQYGLSAYDAEVLTAERAVAEYFEACVSHVNNPKQAANWITGPLFSVMNQKGVGIGDVPVRAEALAQLIGLTDSGVISGKIAKTVFDLILETGRQPRDIVEEKGLTQVSDSSELEAAVDAVIAESPAEVEAYKGGKKKLMGFFVGQVMKRTKGKANPQMVNELIVKKLGS